MLENGMNEKKFIAELNDYALSSRAVRHPYIDSLVEGGFSNMDFALKDFSYQYGIYSSKFIVYIMAVYNRLESFDHKVIIEENLQEEKGQSNHDLDLPSELIASVTGVPHSKLYSDFRASIGGSEGVDLPVSSCAELWSEQFLKLCEQKSTVGIGAIGFGTERIVSEIYSQILKSLKRFTSLSRSEMVFFELHSKCDEEHAAQLEVIAGQLASTPEKRLEVEYGMRAALSLREMFWDKMNLRAQFLG